MTNLLHGKPLSNPGDSRYVNPVRSDASKKSNPRSSLLHYLLVLGLCLVVPVVASTLEFTPALQLLLVVPIMLGAYTGGFVLGVLSTSVAAAGSGIYLHYSASTGTLDSPFLHNQWVLLLMVGFVISALTEALHRTRKRLQRNELALRAAQRVANVGSWEWDLTDDRQVWSEQLYHILGHDPGLPPASTGDHGNYLVPDSWERLKKALSLARSSGISYEGDFQIRRPDGSEGWIFAKGDVIKDALGAPRTLVGTVLDITERKRIEVQLRDSLARMQSVLDTIQEGVITTTEQGQIQNANRAAELLFDRSVQQLRGQPFATLLDSAARPAFTDCLQMFIDPSQPSPDCLRRELQGVRSPTVSFPLELALGRLRLHDCTQLVMVVRDITERKQSEAALHASQAQIRAYAQHLDAAIEAERLRMAREIHDDLGQVLTSIKLDISGLRRKLHSVPDCDTIRHIDNRLNEVSSCADNAVVTVRRIASELRPPMLERLGLSQALRMLCRTCSERSGLQCDTDRIDEVGWTDARALAMYRICQEALTNVARHAHARSVTVSLHSLDSNLCLIVRDDGEGIKPSQLHSTDSFGLIGMRERVHAMHGSLSITGVPARGTEVRVEIPGSPAA